ncbi:cobalt-precorrin-5B (C1)-methyltransferase [Roseovarius halotolerans]|uniref:Cobalt-precorrin-5B C(1)-methyltransferase n=1 Tax=Roseovarius halotolerans TaxID=505353 RepID=A0A1X6YIZ0_9RHOB|nr:cobalt-precorrin-5B (C(1))-methyltransferase [Roseovarius halotolerans]RKT34563.1 cobalt-precorrin-5B (C1)-methyltransferase [Roseovarius halotolerans]SLN21935.1 cobalt-precorrin-6A synthase [Roseovarius halotolerans]
MSRKDPKQLRRGWTTGACATAATRAALMMLWGEGRARAVRIALPGGQTPEFEIAHHAEGEGWAEAGVIKDAGDDPDVTHGAMIVARVAPSAGGILFRAGDGVGVVTKPGLPIPPGEPAINPVPREMMRVTVRDMAARLSERADIEITVSVPGGQGLAQQTWNPRLGIEGGLSILGTTGIVRPFSCAAWIASIHRGIDVARASGLDHVAGCTGATSEKAVQALYDLPDVAMLDMGDFVGGLLKYLARHPVERITIGGGIAKMTKLAQGARDLHSGRSQVDFDRLAEALERDELRHVNTALQAYEISGENMAVWVAENALSSVCAMLPAEIRADTAVIDRAGRVVARAGA